MAPFGSAPGRLRYAAQTGFNASPESWASRAPCDLHSLTMTSLAYCRSAAWAWIFAGPTNVWVSR